MTKETKNPKAHLPVFYVYIHYRNDTGMPFYVGRGTQNHKGKGYTTFYSRAHSWSGRTKRWKRIVNKHGYTIEILMDNLTLDEVNLKEKEFIKLYGKIKDGGILVNYKNGGEDTITDYRHSPETRRKMSENQRRSLQYNLDKYVEYLPNTGCWIWTGQFSDGHPKINVAGKTLNAVRTIYQHFKEVTLEPRRQGLHNTCGCEYCVNPDHFVVDRPCTNEQQTRKLSKEDVIGIKKLLLSGRSQYEVSQIFEVNRTAISAIATGRTWNWLKVEGAPTKIESDYHTRTAKPIICLETGKTFINAREAGVEMFNDYTATKNIRRACTKRGRCKAYKGYHFEYV